MNSKTRDKLFTASAIIAACGFLGFLTSLLSLYGYAFDSYAQQHIPPEVLPFSAMQQIWIVNVASVVITFVAIALLVATHKSE